MKKCEKCGKTFPDDVKFCGECGGELKTVAEAVEEAVDLVKQDVTEAAAEVKQDAANAAAEAKQEAANAATEAKQEAGQKAEKTAEDLKAEVAAIAGNAAESVKKTASGLAEKFKGLSKKSKYILCGICGAVLLCIVALICIANSGKKINSVNRNAINIVYNSDSEAYYVYNGHGKTKKIASGSDVSLSERCTSGDGKTIVVTDGDKNAYVVTIKGAVKFAEDITSFVISENGATVAYVEDYSAKEGGKLKLYTVGNKKTTTVANNVIDGTVVLSANGKNVAYTCIDPDDSTEYKLYRSKNGKGKEKIANTSYALAVSDNGKFTYFIENTSDGSRNLGVYKKGLFGGNKSAIVKEYSGSTVFFNSSLNEILFDHDGKVYSSINGGEKNKLCSGSISGVRANGVSHTTRTKAGRAVRSSCKTLKRAILVSDGTYYLLKNLKTTSKIINSDNLNLIRVSDDAKTIVYLKNDNLYKITNLANPDGARKLRDLSDYSFNGIAFSPDLRSYYFMDGDDLYFGKDKKKPKKIASDVDAAAIDNETFTLYFYIDYDSSNGNVLYASINGSGKRKVTKNIKDCEQVDGNYVIALRENSKDDSLSDILILSRKRAKNIKVTAGGQR